MGAVVLGGGERLAMELERVHAQMILMEDRLLGLGLSSTRFQGRPLSGVMGPRFASQFWAQCLVPVVTRQVLWKCKLGGLCRGSRVPGSALTH